LTKTSLIPKTNVENRNKNISNVVTVRRSSLTRDVFFFIYVYEPTNSATKIWKIVKPLVYYRQAPFSSDRRVKGAAVNGYRFAARFRKLNVRNAIKRPSTSDTRLRNNPCWLEEIRIRADNSRRTRFGENRIPSERTVRVLLRYRFFARTKISRRVPTRANVRNKSTRGDAQLVRHNERSTKFLRRVANKPIPPLVPPLRRPTDFR